MARPIKIGLDYFPLDVNFDDNLESFIDNVGAEGLLFIIRFWQSAYKTNNGEIDCSTIVRRTTLAKRANISLETLEQFINIAGELQLIDKDRYERDKILTSNGVKKRISKVNNERKKAIERKGYELSLNCSANNNQTRGESKAKQSKAKQSKNNNNKDHSHTTEFLRTNVVDDFRDCFDLLMKAGFELEAAKKLSTAISIDLLKKKLQYVNTNPRIKNKLGYLRRSIEESWQEAKNDNLARPERKIFKRDNQLSIAPEINKIVSECANKLERVRL